MGKTCRDQNSQDKELVAPDLLEFTAQVMITAYVNKCTAKLNNVLQSYNEMKEYINEY
jgi:hypothetical protein